MFILKHDGLYHADIAAWLVGKENFMKTVKDFAETLGRLVGNGYNNYKAMFDCFVVDSLADIGHSSNVVCLSLDSDNGNNGMTVEQLFNLFDGISKRQSDCYDYNDFTVDLKHSYLDGVEGGYYGYCIDTYKVDDTCEVVWTDSKKVTFDLVLD